jgi:hypothetical protein
MSTAAVDWHLAHPGREAVPTGTSSPTGPDRFAPSEHRRPSTSRFALRRPGSRRCTATSPFSTCGRRSTRPERAGSWNGSGPERWRGRSAYRSSQRAAIRGCRGDLCARQALVSSRAYTRLSCGRQVFRSGQRREHIPPYQRPLEDRVWVALRGRQSSSLGATTAYQAYGSCSPSLG